MAGRKPVTRRKHQSAAEHPGVAHYRRMRHQADPAMAAVIAADVDRLALRGDQLGR
jgi:hypothetical protein